MSVITLTPTLLLSASSQLAQRVVSSGFTPGVIIGVLNGGAQVARQMLGSLPAEARYCEVCISRPSTRQKKQNTAHQLMRALPLWLCDVLRELESRITSLRKSSSLVRLGDVTLPADVEALLSSASCQILIVDDAIDSGATMQKVKEQLLARFPSVDLRVAVITVTTDHPICDADFTLYHNHTLCRFPWSNDYRD